MPGGAPPGQEHTAFAGIDPTRMGRFGGFWADARRDTLRQRREFARARIAERAYGLRLRRLAEHIRDIIDGMFDPAAPHDTADIEAALNQYARLIEPWAGAVAESMLTDVMRRDAVAWLRQGRRLGRGLREEIASAPIGPAYQKLMREQVDLITSLPSEAAQRVHTLSTEAMLGGTRWEDISDDILATGEVTRARANLIARTETGRAHGTFTMVRAQHVGSEGYIWRTAGDEDVRRQHRRLEGTFHKWGEPPIASEPGQKEMRYHAGAGPNCRCYCEVVLPEEPQADYTEAPQSLAYLEAADPNHPQVQAARERNPRLAERLAEHRERLNQLQAEIYAAASAGDDEEVARLDRVMATTRAKYDELAGRFDRLRR